MKQYSALATSKPLWLSLVLFLYSAKFLSAQNLFLVKEINTAANGSSFPNNLTVCAGKLFFFASDNSGTKYLWATQGTDATTTNIGPFIGANNSLSTLATYNNKLFFPYNDGINGYELWTSDGTSSGTALFKDLYAGAGNAFPAAFTVCNNKLFFVATNNNSGVSRLFVSDGTVAGTVDIRNASLLGGQTSLAVLNNDVYFLSDNGTGSGNGLWKSDGTPAGTVLVKANITPTVGIPGYSAVLTSNLYFNAYEATTGNELWVSDGSTTGTHIVKNLRADGGGVTTGGDPQNMLVYNSKIYFAASDDTHGNELFVSDGTDAGTLMVKDIVPGASGSQPYQSTLYNGLLYFSCSASSELWKTDGTDPGTQLVKGSLFTGPKFAATWNGKMYLTFGAGFYNVWESDGTTAGTKAIQPQNTTFPVTSYTDFGSDPYFTTYNTDLYFNGQCFQTANGFEPVKLTTSSTLAVTWLGVQAQWENISEAKVSWQVVAKQNVKDYHIQHSEDGIIYTTVINVTSTSSNQYSAIVAANANSKNYYRVMEQDTDGKKTYSDVVILRPASVTSLTIYPNPSSDKLYITNITQYNTLKITDINGRIIQQQKILPNLKYIDIRLMTAGMYFLTTISDKKTQTLKFIKY
jgi:ELWxxDGT repeat protein